MSVLLSCVERKVSRSEYSLLFAEKCHRVYLIKVRMPRDVDTEAKGWLVYPRSVLVTEVLEEFFGLRIDSHEKRSEFPGGSPQFLKLSGSFSSKTTSTNGGEEHSKSNNENYASQNIATRYVTNTVVTGFHVSSESHSCVHGIKDCFKKYDTQIRIDGTRC